MELSSFSELASAPSPGGAGADFAGKIDPKSWLRYSAGKATNVAAAETDEGTTAVETVPAGDEYVDMFFLDAFETKGLIYLFGRVPIYDNNDSSNKNNNNKASVRTVSACAIVHNCERNLFVLPRIVPGQFKDDKPVRQSMHDVYLEMNRLLAKIVPKQEGKSFKCKPVKRKYAFEEGAVPRDETEYLKVVYSAKFPAPPAQTCTQEESPSSASSATTPLRWSCFC